MSVRVRDIAFVRFEAPDLDEMEGFLTAFGMARAARDERTLYMRGTDDEGFVHVTHVGQTPRFAGVAFLADSVDDLHTLSSDFGFSEPTELDGPGGGLVVSASDPNGHHVEVVAGRASVGRLPAPTPAPRNGAGLAPRTGVPLRLDAGTSHVKRLGHCVLEVLDFRASEIWYKERLGLVTSDEIALDAIRSVGSTGHFFGIQHTQDRYTTAFYQPFLSDWKNYEGWEAAGAVWTPERAHVMFKEIIARFEEPPMDVAIRDELADFVARRKSEGGAPTDF